LPELRAPHQAQAGPVLVERRDLHVDETERERDRADVLLADFQSGVAE
jgi:hypothetical protein